MEELNFQVEEATIKSIQQAFADGKLIARKLVDFYLHQIERLNPVLRSVIEDTIGTRDKLNNTAGSYALLGSKVQRDASVVDRLRKSGALILGKASLSEWYRFRSLSGVPNGWCARSGKGVVYSCYLVAIVFHSFVNVIESVSVIWDSMWIKQWICNIMVCVSLGSETHSSIICPSVNNSVMGIKPTVGLTSQAGVIPMTPRWDTIGTVLDAVNVLDVIADGLKGKRLGIIRHPFMEKIHGTAESEAFELHIDTLRQRGAQIIDNLKIDQIETILDPNQSGEISIMTAEFKAHINVYLKELDDSPMRSLADIIAFNENNPELVQSEKTNGLGEHEMAILENLAKLSTNGFEKMMKEHKLDAMVTPGSRASAVYAIGGYPVITVPAGYERDGMPFGICFGGLRGSEAKLIEISYAFEQVTKVRKPLSLG
ncbi:hypothetical protein SASPL_128955 [Salvia splendens]|uniref:Amidase domain-containing protein n=1 Tax=Salvia splendens TaxID=180675 RepID=A0A8X8ZMJ4_SALSN|nr:hypothetical protein SASPL_128955 [Salvia splendens]